MSSESQTRKELIDLRLKEAGWDVSDRSQVIEEFFVWQGAVLRDDPVQNGPQREFSDYVLLGKNGKPLAVVEAKRSSKDAEIGREQAKQYCHNIQIEQGGDLPFCFYSNGHEVFFWNLGEAPPQKVHGFPTRQDLERLLHLRKHKKPLTSELINTAIGLNRSGKPECSAADSMSPRAVTLTCGGSLLTRGGAAPARRRTAS
jgi:type I restriction enzyme, R subunit